MEGARTGCPYFWPVLPEVGILISPFLVIPNRRETAVRSLLLPNYISTSLDYN
jgi:hypothetical protein